MRYGLSGECVFVCRSEGVQVQVAVKSGGKLAATQPTLPRETRKVQSTLEPSHFRESVEKMLK